MTNGLDAHEEASSAASSRSRSTHPRPLPSSEGRVSDRSHLAWPFFEPRHRKLGDELERWCADNLSVRCSDDLDSECRTLVRALGAAGFLKLCVAQGDKRPDVRSLA